jgi:uncharacterized surface protein with fasciclin (FAS1) repeats
MPPYLPRGAIQPAPLDDLLQTAARLGGFGYLLAALESAGLSEQLRGDGPFTLFAPTDAAWLRQPAVWREQLAQPAQRPRLTALLRHHLIAGRLQARHFIGQHLRVPTLQGDELCLDGHHGLQADEARVLRSDLRARNGVLHVIDRLLLSLACGRAATG